MGLQCPFGSYVWQKGNLVRSKSVWKWACVAIKGQTNLPVIVLYLKRYFSLPFCFKGKPNNGKDKTNNNLRATTREHSFRCRQGNIYYKTLLFSVCLWNHISVNCAYMGLTFCMRSRGPIGVVRVFTFFRNSSGDFGGGGHNLPVFSAGDCLFPLAVPRKMALSVVNRTKWTVS